MSPPDYIPSPTDPDQLLQMRLRLAKAMLEGYRHELFHMAKISAALPQWYQQEAFHQGWRPVEDDPSTGGSLPGEKETSLAVPPNGIPLPPTHPFHSHPWIEDLDTLSACLHACTHGGPEVSEQMPNLLNDLGEFVTRLNKDENVRRWRHYLTQLREGLAFEPSGYEDSRWDYRRLDHLAHAGKITALAHRAELARLHSHQEQANPDAAEAREALIEQMQAWQRDARNLLGLYYARLPQIPEFQTSDWAAQAEAQWGWEQRRAQQKSILVKELSGHSSPALQIRLCHEVGAECRYLYNQLMQLSTRLETAQGDTSRVPSHALDTAYTALSRPTQRLLAESDYFPGGHLYTSSTPLAPTQAKSPSRSATATPQTPTPPAASYSLADLDCRTSALGMLYGMTRQLTALRARLAAIDLVDPDGNETRAPDHDPSRDMAPWTGWPGLLTALDVIQENLADLQHALETENDARSQAKILASVEALRQHWPRPEHQQALDRLCQFADAVTPDLMKPETEADLQVSLHTSRFKAAYRHGNSPHQATIAFEHGKQRVALTDSRQEAAQLLCRGAEALSQILPADDAAVIAQHIARLPHWQKVRDDESHAPHCLPGQPPTLLNQLIANRLAWQRLKEPACELQAQYDLLTKLQPADDETRGLMLEMRQHLTKIQAQTTGRQHDGIG